MKALHVDTMNTMERTMTIIIEHEGVVLKVKDLMPTPEIMKKQLPIIPVECEIWSPVTWI